MYTVSILIHNPTSYYISSYLSNVITACMRTPLLVMGECRRICDPPVAARVVSIILWP